MGYEMIQYLNVAHHTKYFIFEFTLIGLLY